MKADKNYESELCKIASQGKLINYGEEQSLKIVEELNSGMYEFELAQRKRNLEAEIELKNIILD